MLLDDTKEYDLVWDKVYDRLNFKPSCSYRGHPWRQEIWVFGDILIEKIDAIYQDLGWEKIR